MRNFAKRDLSLSWAFTGSRLCFIAALILLTEDCLPNNTDTDSLPPVSITYDVDYCASTEQLSVKHSHWNIHLEVFRAGTSSYGAVVIITLRTITASSSTQDDYLVARFDAKVDANDPALLDIYKGLTNACQQAASNSNTVPGVLAYGCPGDYYHSSTFVSREDESPPETLNIVCSLSMRNVHGRSQTENLVSSFIRTICPDSFPVGLGPAYQVLFRNESNPKAEGVKPSEGSGDNP